MSWKLKPYKRADGLWDWRLFADNGEQVAESSQGYTERNDALEAFERIDLALGSADVFIDREAE